jgi:hypothetical protein
MKIFEFFFTFSSLFLFQAIIIINNFLLHFFFHFVCIQIHLQIKKKHKKFKPCTHFHAHLEKPKYVKNRSNFSFESFFS